MNFIDSRPLVLALALMGGCSATQKQAEADATYAAEHLRCVDAYDTREEIDACRAAVRMRWGVAPRDGGAQ